MTQDDFSELTARQIQILKAIIEEFMNTAEPVGSETLDKKHNLGVSPATIRNEMVHLTNLNLLTQAHTSSGRAPTPRAIRYYVEHLMKTKDLSVTEEVAVKEQIWDYRQKMDKLLREATRTLAEKTQTLAITTTNDGDIYYAGAANILSMPEFYDYELTHYLLGTLDKLDFWWNVISRGELPFDILMGDSFVDQPILSRCSVVYSKFSTPHVNGAIGVIGPSRLNYPVIIPAVRFMGGLVDEFARNW